MENPNNCYSSTEPDIDIIAVWSGHGYPDRPNARYESAARVRIWRQKSPIVVFSDLDEPDSECSITNASENLATLVKLHYQLSEPIVWLEHYPRHKRSSTEKKIHKLTEEISQVLYCARNGYYFHPRWKHWDLDEARKLIGHSLSMDGEFDLPIIKLVTPLEQQRINFLAASCVAGEGK